MFRFQFDYTLEDMNALSRVSAKTYRWKKVLIIRTVLSLVGIAYLVNGGLILAQGADAAGITLVAAGILFGALAVFFHRGTAWRSKRMMMEGGGVFTVALEEDGVRGESRMGESFYRYGSVIGAYHYKRCYFLFVDKRHAILLPERALIEGDSAALGSFLEDKLKQEIRELR